MRFFVAGSPNTPGNGVIQIKKLEKTILGKDEHHSLYMEALEHFLSGLRT
ncbi:MAG: hypothetical protein PHF23_06950 [Smithellaceae bacterium]|jgi:hypothetical protein|nr:hypothetical protein [Smithellaceae bacterium]